MALRDRRKEKEVVEKMLDVDASMQGTLTFKDPVNLRINGKFEGSLDTKGNLIIGEKAIVNASINGESIVIAGRVNGDVIAKRELKLASSACMTGNIITPILSVVEGAVLQGNCKMIFDENKSTSKDENLTVEELAKYLEVETSSVLDWVNNGKIPARRVGDNWKFDKMKVNEWIASEKIK